MIGTIFLVGVLCALAAWLMYSVLSFAPWVPTRTRDVRIIDACIDWQHVRIFYDLGAGTGHVCRALAKNHSDVQFIGVEISLMLSIIARLRNVFAQQTNVDVRWGDLYRQNYTDADVVYLFGTQKTVNGGVQKLIVPQLRSGTQIVLYNFTFDDWIGTQKTVHEPGATRVSVYSKQ